MWEAAGEADKFELEECVCLQGSCWPLHPARLHEKGKLGCHVAALPYVVSLPPGLPTCGSLVRPSSCRRHCSWRLCSRSCPSLRQREECVRYASLRRSTSSSPALMMVLTWKLGEGKGQLGRGHYRGLAGCGA